MMPQRAFTSVVSIKLLAARFICMGRREALALLHHERNVSLDLIYPLAPIESHIFGNGDCGILRASGYLFDDLFSRDFMKRYCFGKPEPAFFWQFGECLKILARNAQNRNIQKFICFLLSIASIVVSRKIKARRCCRQLIAKTGKSWIKFCRNQRSTRSIDAQACSISQNRCPDRNYNCKRPSGSLCKREPIFMVPTHA